ncbi:MAG: hypothetical protein ACP5VE_12325 [Chthonomonadales bacterium]
MNVLFLCMAGLGIAQASLVPLHAFRNISEWKPNPDGGRPVTFSQDPAGGILLRYVDDAPHWGNLVGPCRVPPNAVALAFRLVVHHASAQAAMHIWLLEPDGDAWVQQVRVKGRSVGELSPGTYQVRMPVAGFAFEARGTGNRNMPLADRMLLGCNFGDLEVTVQDMAWEVRAPGGAFPLPKTPSLHVQRGPRGSIAVLDLGDRLPGNFHTAHPPAKIAQVLQKEGFGCTRILAGDFADSAIFNRENFDAVVLPFGPYFPAAARASFLAYLKAGGSFLATGGYAFDEPVVLTAEGWVSEGSGTTAAEMGGASTGEVPLNTRIGRPGDAMTFAPEQIGVFNPQFHLENVDAVRQVWPEGSRRRWRTHLSGFAACGLIGDNNPVFPPVMRRWEPVLEAEDAQGRPRGAVLAVMHNLRGIFKGSSWAFSGVTSGTDLFCATPSRRRLLAQVLEIITRKVTLHDLQSDLACYRSGETAHISVWVANQGGRNERVTVSVKAGSRILLRRPLILPPASEQKITADLPIGPRTPALCVLTATLVLEPEHRVWDRIEGALAVWRDPIASGGPRLGWKGNRLTVDGRPQFLAGANQTGMMFYSRHENPLVWDQDFAQMAAANLHILRILHFSPFAARGYDGVAQNTPADLFHRPRRLCRQMDAIVQCAMRHRVALFLSLHDWQGVALTDEELEAQADWDRFWAARYRNVPGIMFDVQNEPAVDVPDTPPVRALWNRFLKERYGSDAELRNAWRLHPPEASLPDVPLGRTTDEWDDVRSVDRKRFEVYLLNRWIRANVRGIHEGNPDALVTVGFLPTMAPADKILGTQFTTFSNMHYYGPLETLPLELKLIDRSVYGKGFSLGEFGAQEAHDARTQGSTSVPVAASTARFAATLHTCLGMGAAFLAAWDWKDFDEMEFPWGLVQRGEHVAKPWLVELTQGSLFAGFLPTRYAPPQLYLLIPDTMRIGPQFHAIHEGLQHAVGLLLDQNVPFGILNEDELARGAAIPRSARAIVWPLPYCPPDNVFQKVAAWVRNGGWLYISGDIAFDALRRPTRTARYRELGLPERPPMPPFQVREYTFGTPPVVARVGTGGVFFVPYPLELRRQPAGESIYTQFVAHAGLLPIRISPEHAPVRVFVQHLKGAGSLYTLMRKDEGSNVLRIALPEAHAAVDVAPGGCVSIAVSSTGKVIAAESDGSIEIAGKMLAHSGGLFGIVSLDGQDLTQSRRLLVLPHQQPVVHLAPQRPAAALVWSVGLPEHIGNGRRETGAALHFDLGEVAVGAPVKDLAAACSRVEAQVGLQRGSPSLPAASRRAGE